MAYKPTLHTSTNKPYGLGQAGPTDARSYYYDESNFTYRPYTSKQEVFLYLDQPDFRAGNFSIFIKEGAVINEYWFKDGVADANLKFKETGSVEPAPPPTLQQVLDTDSDLTKDNTIDVQGHQLTLDNINTLHLLNAEGGLAIAGTNGDQGYKVGQMVFNACVVNIPNNTGVFNFPLTLNNVKADANGNLSYQLSIADGQVLFAKAGQPAGSDKLIWDNTNARLGIGMVGLPQVKLDITGNQRLHSGSLTIYGPTESSSVWVSISAVDSSQYNKSITIDQPTMNIRLINGNNDEGGGMRRSIQSLGELQVYSNNAGPFGNYNQQTGYITFLTGGTDNVLHQRAVINNLGQVGIGTPAIPTSGLPSGDQTLDPTAMVQIDSTTRGFLAPRMTSAQRDAIVNPAEGLQIWNLTTHAPNVFDGTVWRSTNLQPA